MRMSATLSTGSEPPQLPPAHTLYMSCVRARGADSPIVRTVAQRVRVTRRPGRIHGAGPNSPTAECRTDRNPLPQSATSGRANAAAPAALPPRSPRVPPAPGRGLDKIHPGSALLLPHRSRPHLHPRPPIASRPLSMALIRAAVPVDAVKRRPDAKSRGRGDARGRRGVGSMRGAAAPGPGEGLRLGRCRGRRPSVGGGQCGGCGTRPRLAVAAPCALVRDRTRQLVCIEGEFE